VHGSVADRPWGQTFGALGLRGLTGQLTLVAEDKSYCVAFDLGAVVGASSPLVADAIARIALTNQLVTSTQVAEITRRIAASPERDEVDVLAETVRFSPEQILKLRRRVVALRAARTFAIEQGEFVVEERIAMPIIPGNEIDARAVVYLGARMHLSEQRLTNDLRHLGAHFVLKQEALGSLVQFGFTDNERPILEALRLGTSLPELEATHREIDPRTAQAVIYALACCGACEIQRPAVPRTMTSAANPVEMPRTRTEAAVGNYGPIVSRTGTGPRDSAVPSITDSVAPKPVVSRTVAESPAIPRTVSEQRAASRPGVPVPSRTITRPAASRTATRTGSPSSPTIAGRTPEPPVSRTTTGTSPAVARTATGPTIARTSTARRVQALIASRLILMEQGADHFALIGVPFDAPIEVVRGAYLNIVRQLHPDRLAELEVPDPAGNAQRLFARIGAAFTVLTDPHRRETYLQMLTLGSLGATPPLARVKTEERVTKAEAAEAFKRGQLELRRDQPTDAVIELAKACELDPSNVDYQAIHAWALFCAASDKPRVGVETRKMLERAVLKSETPEVARFYLGRVERMLGRDREALRHFREVLEAQPNHADAASEVRAIEARSRNSKR
jgi:hypothetical protein